MAQCFWAPCALQQTRFLFGSRLQVACKAQAVSSRKSLEQSPRKPNVSISRKNRRDAVEVLAGDEEDEIDEQAISNFKDWEKNKPPGFGEGKVYDTTIEDDILAAAEKEEELRRFEEEARKKKAEQQAKEAQRKEAAKKAEVPDGVKVKLKYLPRKKNIERDLKAYFKGVRGLLHIRPNELANSKTRDPVCKGSATMTFVDEKHAVSFIEKFKDEKLAFGKVVKRLGFEILQQKPGQQSQARVSQGRRLKLIDVEPPATHPPVHEHIDKGTRQEADKEFIDEVQESLADAMLTDEDEDEGDIDEDEGGIAADELGEDEDGFIFKVPESVLKVVNELQEEQEDSDYSDEEDGEEQYMAWASDEEKDADANDEAMPADSDNGTTTDAALGAVFGGEECITVKLTEPALTSSDKPPDDILKSTGQQIAELDAQIAKLAKRLKWSKIRNLEERKLKKVERRILKLREQKIELLEARILAKIVAAKQVAKRKRDRRRQLLLEAESGQQQGRTGKRLGIGQKQLSDVVSKYFTSSEPRASSDT